MKKSRKPITKVKNPEPESGTLNWVIWAAWADRITFEEIEKKTGLREKDVIKTMRKYWKFSSFKLWRKRVKKRKTKHLKMFIKSRSNIRFKINKYKLKNDKFD